ncbi:MAG: SDR family oxidoreductase, partial [Deltaproteobacteria bacterium]|nr:SDR family oxidoreductase [Deltaproteobacteria bacterium]
MKVIVTGATSFLGTHFVEMVKNKVEDVISLSSKEIDITNSISFPSGDVLYHLAANSRIYMAREKIVEDFQINAIGTINVLEAAYKAGIKKIVYISTALVYEDLYNSNEESPVGSTKVSGPYGVSKLVGELYIKQYAFERGFEYVILRPSGLYGKGMKKNPIYDMVMGFVTGMPIKLHHDINSEFDFIHVKDVARAMVMALDWKDEILNVSHGK